jgi:hypothetical protein
LLGGRRAPRRKLISHCTGTGVGKTFVAAQLLQWLRGQNFRAVAMRPIYCGNLADAHHLVASPDNVPLIPSGSGSLADFDRYFYWSYRVEVYTCVAIIDTFGVFMQTRSLV